MAPVQAVIRTSRWCGGQSGAAVPPTDQIGTPAATTNWRVVMIGSFLAYRVCPLLSKPKECPFSGQIGYACCGAGASHGTGSRPVLVPLVVSRRRGESVRIVSPHSNNPSSIAIRLESSLTCQFSRSTCCVRVRARFEEDEPGACTVSSRTFVMNKAGSQLAHVHGPVQDVPRRLLLAVSRRWPVYVRGERVTPAPFHAAVPSFGPFRGGPKLFELINRERGGRDGLDRRVCQRRVASFQLPRARGVAFA